ncbi:hypothetical protein [Streptomyces sp. NPDC051921]|uniref:hypothetical protein n=1 Tax=Streptomyces sp. NPDC051921 TaxID=3155806 RepID=UPI00343772A4
MITAATAHHLRSPVSAPTDEEDGAGRASGDEHCLTRAHRQAVHTDGAEHVPGRSAVSGEPARPPREGHPVQPMTQGGNE